MKLISGPFSDLRNPHRSGFRGDGTAAHSTSFVVNFVLTQSSEHVGADGYRRIIQNNRTKDCLNISLYRITLSDVIIPYGLLKSYSGFTPLQPLFQSSFASCKIRLLFKCGNFSNFSGNGIPQRHTRQLETYKIPNQNFT